MLEKLRSEAAQLTTELNAELEKLNVIREEVSVELREKFELNNYLISAIYLSIYSSRYSEANIDYNLDFRCGKTLQDSFSVTAYSSSGRLPSISPSITGFRETQYDFATNYFSFLAYLFSNINSIHEFIITHERLLASSKNIEKLESLISTKKQEIAEAIVTHKVQFVLNRFQDGQLQQVEKGYINNRSGRMILTKTITLKKYDEKKQVFQVLDEQNSVQLVNVDTLYKLFGGSDGLV